MEKRYKNRLIYSELRVFFKNGKTFTFKRVLEYGFVGNQFMIKTKTFDDPFLKYLETAKIDRIEERLKREITQRI